MKHFLLIVIVLFSSCSKSITSPAIQAQEPVPLILGGRHYEGRVGDLVLISDGYWGFIDEPRKCFLEDAASLLYLTFNIDPLDPNKMNSLENVELLTSIKRLRIYGKNLDTVDFSPLSALSTLEDLIIEGDISRPPDLTSLEKLTWIAIKGSALESLEGLGAPNIRKMHIEMETFTSLAPLSNLTKLELLEITISRDNYLISIGNIKNVPRLEIVGFDLWANGGGIDLTGIHQLTALKDLDIRGSGYKLINPHEISQLHNLEYIFLELEDENPSIEYLRGLPNLQTVSIRDKSSVWNSEIKEPYQVLDVSPLKESPKLEDIDLRGFIIKNISALNHLENLRFNAITLHKSRLFDETEAERSTKWLIFDVSILRDG